MSVEVVLLKDEAALDAVTGFWTAGPGTRLWKTRAIYLRVDGKVLFFGGFVVYCSFAKEAEERTL